MEERRLVVTVTGSSSENLRALVQQLDADRAWLLQQIDEGRWPDLRLDLAALERELGQMLTRVGELEEESGSR
jgi:hypothetical protein|tara:strand:- start:405 stop:623 length:219 start_codon:yes stop_codon:yes gene_type:complete